MLKLFHDSSITLLSLQPKICGSWLITYTLNDVMDCVIMYCISCSALLPQKKKGSFKSEVIQGGDSPCYTANFHFDKVNDEELSYDRALEITIWEPHHNTNEFVGGIRLGPKPQAGNKNKWMDSVGSEVSQWESMIASPEEWIDEWHSLHSSMKPTVIPA